MGIVRRLSRAIRANLNALLTSDHPEQVIDGAIEELRALAKRARRELITTRGSQKRLAEEAVQLNAEAKDWEGRAALALRNDDEALARQALRQKLALDRKAATVREDAEQHGAAAADLEHTIRNLDREADNLSARKGALVAEVMAERVAANAAGSELNRASARIAALEAEVEVDRLLVDPQRAALDARFAALSEQAAEDVIEDELRGLKAMLSQNGQD